MASLTPKIPPSKGGIYLGTAAYATLENLRLLGVTHRLSCLMTKEEEKAWISHIEGGAPIPELTYSEDVDEGIIVAR